MTRFLIVLFAILGVTATADAASYTFDFNSLADNAVNGSSKTTAGSVWQYMDGVLPGTTVSGATASKSYTGDNHVVGPVSNGNVVPVTLGSTDNGAAGQGIANGNTGDAPRAGAPTTQGSIGTNDAFIYTFNSNSIVITFPVAVTLKSFDWEVFPNSTCKAYNTNCGTPTNANLPDIDVQVNGVSIFKVFGVDPGTNNTFPNSRCGTATNTVACSSTPNSHPEDAPQLIGTWTGSINIGAGQTLAFIDWPAAVGIDRLTVTTRVPLPGALSLFGIGLMALGWATRRKQISVA